MRPSSIWARLPSSDGRGGGSPDHQQREGPTTPGRDRRLPQSVRAAQPVHRKVETWGHVTAPSVRPPINDDIERIDEIAVVTEMVGADGMGFFDDTRSGLRRHCCPTWSRSGSALLPMQPEAITRGRQSGRTNPPSMLPITMVAVRVVTTGS